MICAICKEDKVETSFHWKCRAKHTRYSWCKDCRKLRNKARHKERRDLIWERKSAPCADCGVMYPPWVMQFDHVRGKKLKHVSKMMGHKVGTIRSELDKCEVVCANCHAERSHQRQTK